MKVGDVPQDNGMWTEGRYEICYAIDDKGDYVLAPSIGWEPKKLANDQAWELIRAEIQITLGKVKSGKLSPLAYHMVRNQMNTALLAKYAGFSRWRVWWHLRPIGFARMPLQILQRYASIFDIEIKALQSFPETCE